MKYIRSLVMLLSLLTLSQSITIENDDSKLIIGGFMNIYMDTGDDIGDIGDSVTAKDMVSSLSFGFSRKESDQLKSVGFIQIGLDTTAEYGSDDQFLQKYKSYVGLEHSVFGSIYLGTMTSVNYTLISWTDIGLPHSGSAHSNWDAGDEGTKRGVGYVEDAIFYTKNFKFASSQSLDVYLQTQAAETAPSVGNEANELLRRKTASAAGLIYTIGYFSVGVTDSFAKLERADTLETLSGNLLAFGVRYKNEKLLLALTASQQENVIAANIDSMGIEAALDYKFENGYGITSVFDLRKITGGSAAVDEGTDGYKDVEYITLTLYKVLSSNFKMYIEGKVDLRTSKEKEMFPPYGSLESVEDNNSNAISVGMEYDF